MNKITNKKNGIYLIFAFISIIFFYVSINALYTQTNYYDEDFINNLPNAERFVSKMRVSYSDTNNNVLLIQWEGIRDDNLMYYVYRSKSPIIGKSSFSSSSSATAIVDYIKATNTSKTYTVYDSPIIGSKYYYAVVSYIDDLSFYNGKENTDTSSVLFNGADNISSINYNTNNNLNYVTNSFTVTNTYSLTNIYTVTNTYSFTNTYTITNTYSLTNNNIKNSNSNGSNSINNYYSNYKSQYNRALAEFKMRNYSRAASILEPVSRRNINRALYYDINMLLGKCYKYMGQKKNSLDVFNRIKSYNTQEVNFWINQVLSDL